MRQEFSNDIFNDINELNAEEELTLEDIENIEALFNEQPQVEVPENLFNNIMQAVELKYEEEELPEEIILEKDAWNSIKTLLFNIRHQVTLLDKSFWMASIIILIFGLLSIKSSYDIGILLLGPFVSIFSIYYLYRGRYYNVFEMEAVCKYSVYEITLARTIIIIVYNIIFASAMAFINYVQWNINIWFFIVITWLTPLLISYCFTLYYFYKNGIMHSIIINATTWIVYGLLFQTFIKANYDNREYGYILEVYSNTAWLNINLVLILISTIMLILLFKNMKRVYR